MAAIELSRVSKIYPGGGAIAGLELRIGDGELLVLVGPSGCGKSTVLRRVAGLEEVSDGEIRIGGRVVNDTPPTQRNVAMVFQNYALYPHMTVRGNLEFPLRTRKLRRADIARRVAHAAQLLNLTDVLECLPQALSGGQRQRVAMGRAIVRDAEVFLMDEPLSNLDAQLRVRIRAEIAALQARLGVTMLYVTHDQVEAMTLGQRVAVLRDGRLQQVASPRELYQHPANTFVAGFIGSPGMNVLRAKLESTNGVLGIRLGEVRLTIPGDLRARYPYLTAWAGRELLVGLRPETLNRAVGGAADTWSVRANSAESLGHQTLLYCSDDASAVATDSPDSGGAGDAATAVVAILPGHQPIRPGEVLHLHVDTRQLRLFDPDGTAIEAAG